MDISHENWTNVQPLTKHYISHFERVSSLFGVHYKDEDAWKLHAEKLDQQVGLKADRGKLVQALLEYNKEHQNHTAAIQNIEALQDAETLVVVGGQQAGLLSGPLLSIYKVVTIIQTAQQAEEKLQRKVIPIFWIAGEDHDYDEVNHLHVLNGEVAVEKIQLKRPEPPKTAVSRIIISADEWEEFMQMLDAQLIETEFKEDLMKRLRRYAEESSTLTTYFAKMMAELFGPYGLVLLDSDDDRLRELQSEFFQQLIKYQTELKVAIDRGYDEVRKRGYEPQVVYSDTSAQLFIYEENERRMLHRTGAKQFHTRNSDIVYTEEQLLDIGQTEPSRFSNNVLSRPLMQQFMFPVLATVLGPAEIAYWGLLKEAFDAFQLNMPILIPRLQYTIVESTIQKHLNKYELSFMDAVTKLEQRKSDWFKEQDEIGIEARFEVIAASVQDQYKPLIDDLAQINPGLRKLGTTNLQKITEQIEFLKSRSMHAHQQQFDSALRHWARIEQTLLPLNSPQERVLNVVSFMNKHGDGWLDTLVTAKVVNDGGHYVISL